MFNRTTVAIIAAIAFALGAVVGVLGFNALTAGSGEASISASDAAATLAAQRPTTAATVAVTIAATTAPTAAATDTTAETADPTDEPTTVAAAATVVPAASSATNYSIDSAQSEVRFTLQEDLQGNRVDVIGVTKDVGGNINVDLQNPQNSTIDPLVINARTLETDVQFRNQAIRSRILRSAEDAYEFITFTPTSITGLPTTAITSGPVTFQVTGDLKIVEVTKSVTFDVTISAVSATEITGTGSATINWADYNLSIPNAPGVANVTPEVKLDIDFVAVAAN